MECSCVRRTLFTVLSGLCTIVFAVSLSQAQSHLSQTPFSEEWLRQQALELSRTPYRPPQNHLPDWLEKLDWDQYQSIRFKPEKALWKAAGLPFRIEFFHLGLFYKTPVDIYEVVDGKAHPIRFSEDMFSYGKGLPMHRRQGGLGFAGFRGLVRPDFKRDFFAFLGASYFRAVGASMQYGMSARGIAVDTGLTPEEFPRFTSFWLKRPAPDATTLTLYRIKTLYRLDAKFIWKSGHFNFDIFDKQIEALYLHPYDHVMNCSRRK